MVGVVVRMDAVAHRLVSAVRSVAVSSASGIECNAVSKPIHQIAAGIPMWAVPAVSY